MPAISADAEPLNVEGRGISLVGVYCRRHHHDNLRNHRTQIPDPSTW